MDWYPRYPSRFDLGTLGFSLAERGAYSCLVDTYYANEGPLPDDDAQLASILRVGLDEWRVIALKVRAKFTAKDGKLHHAVCDELLIDQARRAEVSRTNGRAGGRPKNKKNPRKTQRDTRAATGQDAAGPPQTDRQTDRQIDSSLCSESEAAPARAPAFQLEPEVKSNGQTRATRLDPDWQPDDEDRQFADEAGADHSEFAKFRDYFIAAPGQKGLKRDWKATLRNWLRRAAEERGSYHGNAGNGRSSYRQGPPSDLAAARRAAARFKVEQ